MEVQLRKIDINEIKDDFDLCLTTGSERIAYLCDLNYIAYYLGRDIDVPKFKKHSKEEWQNEALFDNNLFERKFYWNAFKEAIAHVAGMWQYESLKKYTDISLVRKLKTINPDSKLNFKNVTNHTTCNE